MKHPETTNPGGNRGSDDASAVPGRPANSKRNNRQIATCDAAQEVARALSALAAIPANCDGGTWLKAGMAAKVAGLTFEEFNAWSSDGGDSYKGERDTRARWDSFKTDGGITAASLFHLAREAGWHEGKPAAARPTPAPPQKMQRKPAHEPRALWGAAEPATADHPYIVRKGGKPDGLRVYRGPLTIAGERVDGWLIVPARAPGGELQSLQFIGPAAGQKKNLAGASLAGAFHVVGELRKDAPAYVVEGIGAAWTMHEATGAAAIVTFGSGNTSRIAGAVQPEAAHLVLIADRGKESAREADAARLGCAWVEMPADIGDGADVNDLAQRDGMDAVRALIQKAQPVAAQPDAGAHGAVLQLRERTTGENAGVLVGTPPTTSSASQSALWDDLGLALDGRGTPPANLDNAVRVLERHRDLQGCIWFDEFTGRAMTSWGGVVREWGEAETLGATLVLQRSIGLARMTPTTVDAAVNATAFANRRNSAQEWLRALAWDGTDRLPYLLPKGFGAAASDYTAAVGRCFLVGMVARILQPGCKVDAMPVFEGAQGLGKSAALQELVGADWFAEAAESVIAKDFFVGLQGKALVEIAELDTFSRSEVTAVKRVLTCQSDRFRAPYGRRAEDHPRTCVFSGTTNRDDWNRDETGARRFWPVACAAIDLAWIRQSRVQLFAEAVARLDRGEKWWDVPAGDALREQDSRREGDEWEQPISQYLASRYETQVAGVMEYGLGITPDKWTKPLQMRVAAVLRGMGWVRADTWWDGRKAKVWRSPTAIGDEGGKGGKDGPL